MDMIRQISYPNPFKSHSIINFQLPFSTEVKLIIYDTFGVEVIKLIDDFLEAADYHVRFEASSLSSGIYYYKIQVGNYYFFNKIILVK